MTAQSPTTSHADESQFTEASVIDFERELEEQRKRSDEFLATKLRERDREISAKKD